MRCLMALHLSGPRAIRQRKKCLMALRLSGLRAIRQRKKCLMARRLSDLPFAEICRPDKAFTPPSGTIRYELSGTIEDQSRRLWGK